MYVFSLYQIHSVHRGKWSPIFVTFADQLLRRLLTCVTDHIHGSRTLKICPCNWVQPFLAWPCSKGKNVRMISVIHRKRLISTVIYRETFLGGGIFNRDDRVRPCSCLQPLFYQWIYILCRNGNSYVLN